MVTENPQYVPPSVEELKAKTLHFLETCQPQTLRELKKSKELDKYLQAKAEAAKEAAESMIRSGIFEKQAWYQAVNQEILDSPLD